MFTVLLEKSQEETKRESREREMRVAAVMESTVFGGAPMQSPDLSVLVIRVRQQSGTFQRG